MGPCPVHDHCRTLLVKELDEHGFSRRGTYFFKLTHYRFREKLVKPLFRRFPLQLAAFAGKINSANLSGCLVQNCYNKHREKHDSDSFEVSLTPASPQPMLTHWFLKILVISHLNPKIWREFTPKLLILKINDLKM